jgi:hypothetical protein
MPDTLQPGLGNTQRGLGKPPNETGPAGARVNNGYLPLTKGGSTVNPPNSGPGGDHRAGSFPLGESGSPITPPNHQFSVGTSKMPQPNSAVEPGKGAVPVNPWDAQGNPSRTRMPAADMARPKR